MAQNSHQCESSDVSSSYQRWYKIFHNLDIHSEIWKGYLQVSNIW